MGQHLHGHRSAKRFRRSFRAAAQGGVRGIVMCEWGGWSETVEWRRRTCVLRRKIGNVVVGQIQAFPNAAYQTAQQTRALPESRARKDVADAGAGWLCLQLHGPAAHALLLSVAALTLMLEATNRRKHHHHQYSHGGISAGNIDET